MKTTKTTGEKMTPVMAALAVLYIPLAAAMYYYHEATISLGINIMYKMVFAIIIAGISFMVFLIETDLTRAQSLLKYIVLLSLPHIIAILVSLPLWTFQTTPMATLRRGLFAQIYSIGIIVAVAGIMYVFGKNGLWVNLIAMVAANSVTILGLIRNAGLGEYWQALKTLILSFGMEVSTVISKAEIHELTFAMGLYILYLVMDWRSLWKSKLFLPMLFLTSFCYLSGFKRIGVVVIIACLFIKIILSALIRGKGDRWGWLIIFTVGAVVVMFLYISAVRMGLFEILEKYFGIDTMGRDHLSQYVEEYYHIGPGYMGRGSGFVSKLFNDRPGDIYTVRALHNDVLGIYVDLGFWGFWMWMLSFLPLRVMLVTKWQGVHGGILCACYSLFVLGTALTDNTIYYIYVIGTAAILTMGGYSGEKKGIGGNQR